MLSQELAKPIIALKPRDIFIYPIKNINFAILLTYSGKTPDILTVNDYLKKNNIKSYIVTNQKKIIQKKILSPIIPVEPKKVF